MNVNNNNSGSGGKLQVRRRHLYDTAATMQRCFSLKNLSTLTDRSSQLWLELCTLPLPLWAAAMGSNHHNDTVSDSASATFYVNNEQQFFDTAGFDETSQLDGEIVVAPCEHVLLYSSFTDNRQGVVGTLFCTTFRLCFIPADTTPTQEPCCSRSLFARDTHDVPLMCIDEIYYSTGAKESSDSSSASGGKKYRLMIAPLPGHEVISHIKIITKDYRVLEFDSRISPSFVSLLNIVFHFAFPTTAGKVFQCSMSLRSYPSSSSQPSSPSRGDMQFDTSNDWRREMHRLGVTATGQWRLSKFNAATSGSGRIHVKTYPQCVVVPKDSYDRDLVDMCPNFTGGRIPVWVWSDSITGCALLRCAQLNGPETAELPKLQQAQYLRLIQEAHPRKLPAVIINVAERLPSLNKLYASYDALKRLCVISSPTQFEDTDSEWRTLLEDTNWLQTVALSLRVCGEVVRYVQEQTTVLLQEPEARDYVCVVSALAQLCLDPYYRTIAGFAVLIQKEWLAFAHPFGRRLFNFHAPDTAGMTPVFLLFLDCVHQLLRLNPFDFEFSALFLVSFWDVILSGLATPFLYDGVHETSHLQTVHSVWPLERFYTEKHARLFINSAFAARRIAHMYKNETKISHSLVKRTLIPPRYVAELELWLELYLRWAPPAHIRQGGAIQRQLLLNGIANELSVLTRECATLLNNQSSMSLLRKEANVFRRYSTETAEASSSSSDSQKETKRVQASPKKSGVITSAFPYNNDTMCITEPHSRLPKGILESSRSGARSMSVILDHNGHAHGAASSTRIDMERLCTYYTNSGGENDLDLLSNTNKNVSDSQIPVQLDRQAASVATISIHSKQSSEKNEI